MEKIRFLRIFGIIRVTVTIILAVTLFCVFSSESDLPSATVCTLKLYTGYDCPLCGCTRATVCLMHLRIADAFAYNPVYTCFIAPAALIFILQDIFTVIRRFFSEDAPLSAAETLIFLICGKLPRGGCE